MRRTAYNQSPTSKHIWQSRGIYAPSESRTRRSQQKLAIQFRRNRRQLLSQRPSTPKPFVFETKFTRFGKELNRLDKVTSDAVSKMEDQLSELEKRILQRLEVVETALEDEMQKTTAHDLKLGNRFAAQKMALDNQGRLMVELKGEVRREFKKTRKAVKEIQVEET